MARKIVEKTEKTVETVEKTIETVTKTAETVSELDKTVSESTYTVDEFANAPQSVDASTPDMVRAAFKVAGIESATVEEAKKIVKEFKEKEV